MASGNPEFSDEFLLQRIIDYPALYKKDSPDYKSHLKKENCWQKVATAINVDVAIVKSRFKSLREKYRRELKLEEAATRSGSGSNNRKPWSLKTFFDFMMDGSQHRA
ncbi:hypothetical protein ABEB36_009356 [Hypothenemus hampei]|uniref:MADF domain-containing protein n=1 Tax=Hypothenemus hampei TaxID=57062 RepID=A0ABD1EI71_HYPHA